MGYSSKTFPKHLDSVHLILPIVTGLSEILKVGNNDNLTCLATFKMETKEVMELILSVD